MSVRWWYCSMRVGMRGGCGWRFTVRPRVESGCSKTAVTLRFFVEITCQVVHVAHACLWGEEGGALGYIRVLHKKVWSEEKMGREEVGRMVRDERGANRSREV